MKVSIITAAFNNCDTIENTIQSVISQKYENIEYIVVDGGSSDGTVEIIQKHQDKIAKWVSEYDKGIYHALNKGLKMSTGDIIGFLHADDVYANDKVIEIVVAEMRKRKVESCYGDLLYVSRKNIDRVIRYWKSCPFREGLLQNGWMPPHPTFFVKKEIYEKYGYFNTDFKIAADYELMLRFLGKKRISTHYIPEILIRMRVGGISNRNFKNLVLKTSEDYKAWKLNNLKGSSLTILRKNLNKIPQFFRKY